ncbi:MAG: hypothetical protein NZM44_01360, partial [Candidatus Calescibacterium sp.]|nr:hypothetical protein [Candidatus Calescibacterium sp.]
GDFIIALLKQIKKRWFYYVRDIDTDLSLEIKDELFPDIPVLFEMANYLFWDRLENYEFIENRLAWERYPAYTVVKYDNAEIVPMHYLHLAMFSGEKTAYGTKVFKNFYFYNINMTTNITAVRYTTLEEIIVNILNDIRIGNGFFPVYFPYPNKQIHVKVELKQFLNYSIENMKNETMQTFSFSMQALAVPLFAESITRNALSTTLNSIQYTII